MGLLEKDHRTSFSGDKHVAITKAGMEEDVQHVVAAKGEVPPVAPYLAPHVGDFAVRHFEGHSAAADRQLGEVAPEDSGSAD